MHFEITVDVEDKEDADRLYEAVEKLVSDMGEIGTVSMRGVEPIDISTEE